MVLSTSEQIMMHNNNNTAIHQRVLISLLTSSNTEYQVHILSFYQVLV